MFRNLLIGAGLVAFAGTASAQTTLLTETFDSGVVPPTGWSETNNGNSAGWEPDFTGLKAWHDDYTGYNDNSLVSPAFDASGVTEMYMHAVQDQAFATWRDTNDVDLSIDGGLTFTTVYSETSQTSADGTDLEVDLSAYAGNASVTLSFHYTGDYANEWDLVDLLVDDTAPPPPPPYWGHLPTTFVSANGYRENFDGLGGVVPSHMAVNMLDAATRADHAEAWCNVGQLAACLTPYDGGSNLEMGVIPGNTNYPVVSNALIIGLDGTGVSDFTMSFQAIDFGEELSDDDGVFVSSDGLTWEAAATDWAALAGFEVYQLATCDLASTTVDVSGEFYVAIAQSDNFPYGYLDGVGVDNVTVGCPVYTASNLVAGGMGDLAVSGANPAAVVYLAYSLLPGPITTPYGLADLGAPYKIIGAFAPDASGNIATQLPIPPLAAGVTAWTQGLEISGAGARFTNGLKVTVQ